jgi:hypothetical protein
MGVFKPAKIDQHAIVGKPIAAAFAMRKTISHFSCWRQCGVMSVSFSMLPQT